MSAVLLLEAVGRHVVASEFQLMLRAAAYFTDVACDRKNRRAVDISRRQHLLPAAVVHRSM